MIAVDLAGFGESAAYPEGVGYNMSNAVDNITDNFAAWGVDKPHVVGNSLGGAIALELGARGVVSSVTALSPAGFFGVVNKIQTFVLLIMLRITSLAARRGPAIRLAEVLGAQARRQLALHPPRAVHRRPGLFGDAMALKHCTGFERTILSGIRYAFKLKVDVPTTIAWGTRDLILPYSSSAIAQERLPEARHVALPHCGHVPMVDDPELIVRVIEQTVAALLLV